MKTRRKFLAVSGIALGGFAIGGLSAEGLEGTAEEDVLKIVANYGATESVRRETSGGKETVTVKARVKSWESLGDTFTGVRRPPFGNIYAAGNTMSFEHRGVSFRLENLA